MKRVSNSRRGGTLIMTLIFVVMFLVIFIGLTQITNRQYKQGVLLSEQEAARHIAEAGLQYGSWRLRQNPENISEETQQVTDDQETVLGEFTVSFTKNSESDTHVLIHSVGKAKGGETRAVSLDALFGKPSLSQYSFVTNSDVWYGGQLTGRIHSNGGVRIDTDSTSLISSAKDTYLCMTDTGCSNEIKPGVWGDSEQTELWQHPVVPVDYGAITSNLLSMKQVAESEHAYYEPSEQFGYHLVFNTDHTYEVYRVKTVKPMLYSYTSIDGWQYASHDIDTEELVETKSIPESGLIFIADTVWVEGDVRDHVIVASGRFPDTPATNTDIIINNNISYDGVKDGSRSFAAIAQRNIIIPYYAAPQVLQLDGAFVAAKGTFGRRYYETEGNNILNQLNRFGMIMSNAAPSTVWLNPSSEVTSGYAGGDATYDMGLFKFPPLIFPTHGMNMLTSWREE